MDLSRYISKFYFIKHITVRYLLRYSEITSRLKLWNQFIMDTHEKPFPKIKHPSKPKLLDWQVPPYHNHLAKLL